MALSRLAKKFRELEKNQEPTQTTTQVVSKKGAKAKTAAPVKPPETPAPAPVVVEAAPVVAEPEPPKPGKRSRELVKRERFVYVPTKVERRTPAAPAQVAPRSNKLSAKLMTKNLALPPEDDTPGGLLGVAGRGRI